MRKGYMGSSFWENRLPDGSKKMIFKFETGKKVFFLCPKGKTFQILLQK